MAINRYTELKQEELKIIKLCKPLDDWYIKNDFANTSNSLDNYKIYSSLNNTIGICSKIVTANDKKKIEQMVNSITDWDEMLPLALEKIISEKIDLPTQFYNLPSEKQSKLLKNIAVTPITLKNILYYTDSSNIENFCKLNFAYNLLSAILVSENQLDFISMKTLNTRFYEISKILLTNLYRDEMLNDPTSFSILPTLHRFSLYYVMAIDCDDAKEKISLLRQALKEEPEMKNLINHILEELKNEEEIKKQEQIKTASPELVAMAEQLKTMLAAFPPNSPELLAIKQSPMYKQVAFLIEE